MTEANVPRTGARLRLGPGDAVGALVSLLVASLSFLYPYGRDQSAFAYVAREWGLGNVPFQSTFEIKPPSIYLTYLVAFRLFGEGTHAIRVLDFFATVVPTAIACAYLSAPADAPPPRGRIGLSLAVASLVYYLPFDFWNTAQCESFCSAFSVVAAACAVRVRRPALAGFLVGLASTIAVSYKPTVALVAVGNAALLALVLRSRRAPVRAFATATAAMVGGIAIPVVALFAYFGAKGALPAMHEALVVTNRQYVVAGKYVHGWEEGLRAFIYGVYFWQALLVVPLVVVAVRGLPLLRRPTRPLALPYAAAIFGLVTSILSVVVQLKFFVYHWGAVTGFVVLAFVLAAADLGAAAAGRGRDARIAVALVIGLFVSAGRDASRLLYETKAYLYAVRHRDDEPLAKSFAITQYFSHYDSRTMARWLVEHAAPGDTLVVRGFEPQIYMMSGLRYGGRFFASTWLTQKQFSTRTVVNGEEDYRFFKASPPRWVVAFSHLGEGVDAATTYEKLGYVARAHIAVFVVLERGEHLDFPETTPW